MTSATFCVNRSLTIYKKLLKLAEGKSVMFEEYVRERIYLEEQRLGEAGKICAGLRDIEALSRNSGQFESALARLYPVVWGMR
jgi:hypothetical protein